ncbi:MAG: OmpA family protein [Deltaproteobacteria bacterium]
MKKIMLFATAVSLLLAGTAMADSIEGKVGITARGGASYVFNSEFTDEGIAANPGVNKDIKPGVGWTGGGGLMYGITENLAVTFDVIYLQTTLKMSDAAQEYKFATGKTVDFSLGAQWRFIPKSRFVPYIGAGFDVLWNKLDIDDEFRNNRGGVAGSSLDTATTFGGHLSAGADFFITPNIALNAEVRGLYSTKGDITLKEAGNPDNKIAKYNPSNISGFLGIRFFFGGPKEEAQARVKETAPEPPPPVEEMKKPAEVERTIIEKGRVTLNVEFDTGKTIVKPAYYKEIENVADAMKKYPTLNIVVEGHTDNIRSEKYNLKLSQKRAEAIKEVMVKNFNIESSRITAKGFGFSKPIGDNKTKEGRQSNRRVEAAVEYEYTVKK